ncbi:uncharacterized protein LOC136084271 isoform X1 [Hydra vulgaris]|uniref:Uncharacterized protein LOC136084271 isoform X1 n=1 Tax=Hydra vulgaris TaxID=6087 RepID=A0ABM4CFD0_HYDVU
MEKILVNCVLCKKSTDNDRYHFGCYKLWENDLLKICNTCADSISGISYQEKVVIVEKAFQKFTKQSICKILSSALLKSIFVGQLYSYRHIIYSSGMKSKRNLMDQDLMYLLTNQQKDDLLLTLGKFSNNLKDSDFTFKVLVPEAILYLFAELEGISRNKAEVLLSSYSLQRTNELVSKLSDEDDDFFLGNNFFL